RTSRAAPPARNRSAIHRQQAVIASSSAVSSRSAAAPSRPILGMCYSGGTGDVWAENSTVERETGWMDNSRRLIIADDHPLFRGALREAVSGLFEDVEIAEAGSFDDVTKLLERGAEVDLILLDLAMPGVRGFSGLMYLRAQYPSVPLVAVSAHDATTVIRRCMDFGALGFIPKTLGIETMRGAITRVFEGGIWTPADIDLGVGSDAETAELMARLASLTPQ